MKESDLALISNLGQRLADLRLEVIENRAKTRALVEAHLSLEAQIAQIQESRHYKIARAVARPYWRLKNRIRRLLVAFHASELEEKSYASGETFFALSSSELPDASLAQSLIEKPTPKNANRDVEPRLVALFLPQFRRCPENDQNWGSGFTEWTNVVQGTPLFLGHWQPRRPLDGAYYDTSDGEVLRAQASLALESKIAAFAHYMYWFDHKSVLHEVLDQHCSDAEITLPFMLVWANENWTRRWDGGSEEMLLNQTYATGYASRLAHHLEKYFKSPRYFTVDGKPVFAVYAPSQLPNEKEFISELRRELAARGFPKVILGGFETFGETVRVGDALWDESIEFPPHPLPSNSFSAPFHTREENRIQLPVSLNDWSKSRVSSYSAFARHRAMRDRVGKNDYVSVPSVMLAWDNTARRPEAGHIFADYSPEIFGSWLRASLQRARAKTGAALRGVVFINAWNEWAEGTYLEPDEDYGFAALEAVKAAVHDFEEIADGEARMLSPSTSSISRKRAALVVHAFHEGPTRRILDRLSSGEWKPHFDAYATTSVPSLVQVLRDSNHFNEVVLVENRGRDVWPFLKLLPMLADLGYEHVLKIHSKENRSFDVHGKNWSDSLIDRYLSPGFYMPALKALQTPSIGVVVSADSFITPWAGSEFYVPNYQLTSQVLSEIGVPWEDDAQGRWAFAAGTFFCARIKAILPASRIPSSWFRLEPWQEEDGEIEHAVERIFVAIASSGGYGTAVL